VNTRASSLNTSKLREKDLLACFLRSVSARFLIRAPCFSDRARSGFRSEGPRTNDSLGESPDRLRRGHPRDLVRNLLLRRPPVHLRYAPQRRAVCRHARTADRGRAAGPGLPDHVDRFGRDAQEAGLLPIPYSACFFKGNLHVYAFSGPVRGFDLAAIGPTARQSERALMQRVNRLKSRIPAAIARAQRELLEGKRRPRHQADLRVLTARLHRQLKAQDLVDRDGRRSL